MSALRLGLQADAVADLQVPAPDLNEARLGLAVAHRAMEPGHVGRRQGLGAFEQGAGLLLDAAHLALLLVGHRQDAQGEDLVDLGAVEEVARALRCHHRVVVENDR